VFGHGHAGGGADQGGGGGNVEGPQPVAAGADHVENFLRTGRRVERRGDGFIAQGAGEGGDFGGRFAFLRQRGQKIGLERRRHGFIGQRFDSDADLFVGQRPGGGQLSGKRCKHAMMLRRKWKTPNGKMRREARRSIATFWFPRNSVTYSPRRRSE
jgi:hypothetical protein